MYRKSFTIILTFIITSVLLSVIAIFIDIYRQKCISKEIKFRGIIKDVKIYREERAGPLGGTYKPPLTIIYGTKGEVVMLPTDMIEGLRLGVFGQIVACYHFTCDVDYTFEEVKRR